MPIKEESFRIGCGRYIQGKGYINRCLDEVKNLGNTPLLIGDTTSLSITRDILTKNLDGNTNKFEFITHDGTCEEQRAKEIAYYAAENGFDVFIGIGGGVIMDFVKLCAYFAKIPVINIPTSSATCAAYTPLSIRYTPDGKTVGSIHYSYEVDAVICDTEIIAGQPKRLLLAGVFDALAKFVEIKQRFREDMQEYPMGLDYAYVMAKRAYNVLSEKTKKCIEDIENNIISDDVENMIFICIAIAGVISGVARGSNQTALGHKFYETTKFLFPEESKPYLHGEIVGIGLLLQNHFNGEEENNAFLVELMKEYNMPYSVTSLGISKNSSNFDAYNEKLCNSSAIDKDSKSECERLKESLNYLWGI